MTRYLVLVLVISLVSTAFVQNIASADISKNDFPRQTITVGDKKLDVMIADTPETRTQGLQNQDKLDYEQGMLFVVQAPQIIPIWMPNMKFSLDIIWFDENGNIVHIEKNVPPCTSQDLSTCPIYYQNGLPAKYVLEATSGFVDKSNITMNSKLAVAIPEFSSYASMIATISIIVGVAIGKFRNYFVKIF